MVILIEDRYEVREKLGEGSFGIICKCYDRKYSEYVAAKFESRTSMHSQLRYECKVYTCLKGECGFPKIYRFIERVAVEDGEGPVPAGSYDVMVMELLGPSLETLFQQSGTSFSMKTILQLGKQMIRLIKTLHNHSFIHRDLKPDNFLINKETGALSLIDFGLSKRYRDPTTHTHIMYREDKSLTGTPRYASINMHLGIESSRRDDIEAIDYILMYFFRGRLPWQGMRALGKKQKYQKILEKKMATPINVLHKGAPYELQVFAEYARSLRFADNPDYDYLERLFSDAATRLGLVLDSKYDWMMTIHEEEEKEEGDGQEDRGCKSD